MARRDALLTQLEAIAAEFEPRLREAFMAAVESIRSEVILADMVERIAAGDLEGALRTVSLDPAAFQGFQEVIRQVYIAGGQAAMDGIAATLRRSGARVSFRFNVRSPRAEAWLAEVSSQLVTAITQDQRAAIREALREGMEAGRNPYTVARSIVGTYNRQRRRREGGIIGITAVQRRYVSNTDPNYPPGARQQLLSGDPEMMKAYLTRERRDRTHDRTVARAIREGRALTPSEVDKIVGRYADRLLGLRGDTIARTEMMGALSGASREGVEQVVDTGRVQRQFITKRWRTVRDARVRDSHRHLEGAVVGLDERFSNGLRHPHERGAPARETVACRCMVTHSVDYLAQAGLAPVARQTEPA